MNYLLWYGLYAYIAYAHIYANFNYAHKLLPTRRKHSLIFFNLIEAFHKCSLPHMTFENMI